MLVVIFSLTNYPLANFSSLLKAIKRLYFVRSKDKNLFKWKKSHNKKLKQFFNYYDDNASVEKMKDLKIISVGNYDYICLYYAKLFGKYFCCKYIWPKHKKMVKTLDEGTQRLN